MSKNNNFDILRVLMAYLVLYHHSFPIFYGASVQSYTEHIHRFTNSQTDAGQVAVGVFFILSGFLITGSWFSTNNFILYCKKRFFRIYPAAVCSIIFVFIIGFFVTSNQSYLTDINYLKLFRSFINLYISNDTLNIFQNNPYPLAVNGSLWTLIFELICYFFIAILGATKLLNKTTSIVIFIICYIFTIGKYYFGFTSGFIFVDTTLFLSTFFFGGSYVYFIRSKILIKTKDILLFILLLIVATSLNSIFVVLPLFLILFTFYIGFLNKTIRIPKEIGDLSYGVYIFAFPIQQTTIYLYPNIDYYSFFVITSILTFFMAFLSWHLVEKKVLIQKGAIQ